MNENVHGRERLGRRSCITHAMSAFRYSASLDTKYQHAIVRLQRPPFVGTGTTLFRAAAAARGLKQV